MSLARNSDLKPFRDVRPEDFSSEEAVRIEMPWNVLGIETERFSRGVFDPGKLQLRVAQTSKRGSCGYEHWTRGERSLCADTSGRLCFALGDMNHDLSFMVVATDNFFRGYPIELSHLGDAGQRKDEKIFMMCQLQRYSNLSRSKIRLNEELNGFMDDRFLMALYVDWAISSGAENIISIPAERVAPLLYRDGCGNPSKRDALRRKYNGGASHLGMIPAYSKNDGLPAYFWLPKNYDPSRYIKKSFFR